MFRLLLKVHTIRLRLKEEVQIQVFIKKGQQKFVIPQKAKLINGIATLNAHSQFFVSQQNPKFEIFVMILCGSGRKSAGKCDINLHEWEQKSNNTTVYSLLECPDKNAKIDFDFMYLSCDVRSENKTLLSLAEVDSQKKSLFIKQMQDKNSFLTLQNNRLTNQVQALKKQNKQLTDNRQHMEQQYQKNSQQYTKKLQQKSMQIQESENSLNLMRQKMMKIQEIVHQSDEGQLREKVEMILNQYSNISQN